MPSGLLPLNCVGSRARLAATVVVLVLTATACTPAAEKTPTSMPPSEQSSLNLHQNMGAIAPLEAKAVSSATVPVYWLGVNGSDIQLYREFRPVPSTVEAISAAIREMTTAVPDDSDYFSPWQPVDSVTATVSSNNTVTVDIAAEAFAASLDEGVAQRAVQQLVYTATAAAAMAGVLKDGGAGSVVVLVDGKAGYEAFGHVKLGEPMRRDPRYLAPIWIIDPQENQSRSGQPITISGSGISPDSILQWQVVPVGTQPTDPSDRQPSATGETTIDSLAGGAGQFTFELVLPPGTYRVSVFDRNEQGEKVNTDTRTFTIVS